MEIGGFVTYGHMRYCAVCVLPKSIIVFLHAEIDVVACGPYSKGLQDNTFG